MNPIKVLPEEFLVATDFEIRYFGKEHAPFNHKKGECSVYIKLEVKPDLFGELHYPFFTDDIEPLEYNCDTFNQETVMDTLRAFDLLHSDFYDREFTFEEVTNDHNELFTSEVLVSLIHQNYIKRNKWELRAMLYYYKWIEHNYPKLYQVMKNAYTQSNILTEAKLLEAVKYGYQRAFGELLVIETKRQGVAFIPFENKTRQKDLERVA